MSWYMSIGFFELFVFFTTTGSINFRFPRVCLAMSNPHALKLRGVEEAIAEQDGVEASTHRALRKRHDIHPSLQYISCLWSNKHWLWGICCEFLIGASRRDHRGHLHSGQRGAERESAIHRQRIVRHSDVEGVYDHACACKMTVYSSGTNNACDSLLISFKAYRRNNQL